MIVERVPEFLLSRKNLDVFLFDQNGRFIYIHRCTDEPNPIFLIYDVMFNNYVELKADSTLQNADTVIPNGDVFLFIADPETCVIASWDTYAKIQLFLLRFDLVKKTYSLADQLQMTNSEHPELIGDPSRFGLFYTQICQDGRWANEEIGEELVVYAIQLFKIESNKIVFLERRELGYSPYGQPSPKYLHLCGNKLWVIRESKYPKFVPHTSRELRVPDPEFHICISYFDLNKKCPQEVIVGRINEEGFEGPQWTHDSLIIQLTLTTFGIFDLNRNEWSNLESSIVFLDPRIWEIDEKTELGSFERQQGNPIYFGCDQNLALTAVNSKTGNLHRVALKKPFKLVEIVWIYVLNAGLLNKLPKSLKNLPYSQIF